MSFLRDHAGLRNFVFQNKQRYLYSKLLDYYLLPPAARRAALRRGKDLVSCGMLRSGSTLVYNILRHIAAHKQHKHDGFYALEKDFVQDGMETVAPVVWKTHCYSRLLVKRVRAGRSLGVFTHRNLLDSIASQVQKGWIPDMDKFLAGTKLTRYVYTSILYDEDPCFLSIAYRDLMHDKEAVIALLYERVMGEVDEEVVRQLHEKTEVKRVKKQIASMAYDRVDHNFVNKETGLHRDHINDPRIGKYSGVLSEEEVAKIRATPAYREFCRHFLYDLDNVG